MKRLVMTSLIRAEAMADGQGARVELETTEGPLELRFTLEDAARLVAALQAAQAPVRRQHLQPVERWETAIDPVNQDAVILARYPDRTTQETRIPRNDVRAIASFLEQASKRFEAGAEMRQ